MRTLATILALSAALLAASARAQEPQANPAAGILLNLPAVPAALPLVEPRPPIKFTRLQTEQEALAIVAAHQEQQECPWAWRYHWLPETTPARVGGLTFVVNATINRTELVIAPDVLDGGRILAWNLLKLTDDLDQFIDVVGRYELLADRDPFFHERNQLVEALVVQKDLFIWRGKEKVLIAPKNFVVAEASPKDGYLHCEFFGRKGWVRQADLAVVKIAPFAAHVETQQRTLQDRSGSRAVFLRGDDFVRLAFSQIGDGIYYELLGIDGKNVRDVLKRVGAVESNIEKLAEEKGSQRGDIGRWGALYMSLVTGNPRSYVAVASRSTAPGDSANVATLTFDLNANSKGVHPVLSLFLRLFQHDFDGGEGIFFLPNGMPFGVLYDGQGALVDVAPASIATDRFDRTPQKFLQPGISCHRCHDTWFQDAGNNVEWAIKNGGVRGGIYDLLDKELKGLTLEQVFNVLIARYKADLTPTMNDARRLFAVRLAEATGVPAAESIQAASELFAEAAYGDTLIGPDCYSVSPAMALRKLGVKIEGDPTALEQRQAFGRFVPEVPLAKLREFHHDHPGEDGAVAGLRQWDRIQDHPDAPQLDVPEMHRVYTYLAFVRDLSSLEQEYQEVQK